MTEHTTEELITEAERLLREPEPRNDGNEPPISTWLLYGTYLLAILLVFMAFMDNLYYADNSAEASGMTFWAAIGAFIAVWCGKKCARWAMGIRKNVDFAYVIGFFLGLLGLLCYWAYYKTKKE